MQSHEESHITNLEHAQPFFEDLLPSSERLDDQRTLIFKAARRLRRGSTRLQSRITHPDAQGRLIGGRQSLPPPQLSFFSQRWRKLLVDLKDDTGGFNISKVPEIFDNIKYDYLHNKDLLLRLEPDVRELYDSAEMLSNFVVPNEFGILDVDRVRLALRTVRPLCRKIKNDILWWSEPNYRLESLLE